jgi:hypothetical protein
LRRQTLRMLLAFLAALWKLRYQPHLVRYSAQWQGSCSMTIARRMEEKNAQDGAQNQGHKEPSHLSDGTGHMVIGVPLCLKGAEYFVSQSSLAISLVIFGVGGLGSHWRRLRLDRRRRTFGRLASLLDFRRGDQQCHLTVCNVCRQKEGDRLAETFQTHARPTSLEEL